MLHNWILWQQTLGAEKGQDVENIVKKKKEKGIWEQMEDNNFMVNEVLGEGDHERIDGGGGMKGERL